MAVAEGWKGVAEPEEAVPAAAALSLDLDKHLRQAKQREKRMDINIYPPNRFITPTTYCSDRVALPSCPPIPSLDSFTD